MCCVGEQARGGLLSGFLERQRFAAALPYLHGSVLDVGCGSGRLCERYAGDYVGVDRDLSVITLARAMHPDYEFRTDIPHDRTFNTVVALAVIEHVRDPGALLAVLGARLAPGGCIVLTTPHPFSRIIHDMGAKVGLFSREAAEEHEQFLDRADIERAAAHARLQLHLYRRFLGGINQLAVLLPNGA